MAFTARAESLDLVRLEDSMRTEYASDDDGDQEEEEEDIETGERTIPGQFFEQYNDRPINKSTSIRSGTIIARRDTSYHRHLIEHPHLYRNLIEFNEDLIATLQTGDLVLFNGKGCTSCAIKTFSWSDWSHVGIVDRRTVPNNPSQYQVFLWESVRKTDGTVDILTGSAEKTGVRLVDLYDMSTAHPSNYMGVVKLQWPKDNPDCYLLAQRSFREFQRYENRKPYEASLLTLIRLAVSCCFLGRNSFDISSYFCSELVAETYKAMGLFPEDYNSSDVLPRDFFDIDLPLLNGVKVACLMFVASPEEYE